MTTWLKAITVITKAGGFVTLVDSRGQAIAQTTQVQPAAAEPLGMTTEHLEEIKRRMAEDDGKRIAFDEVIRRVCVPTPE
jgi:hypothetical protein